LFIGFFPNSLGGISFEKAAKLYEGRKPFFSMKRVFSPRAPLFPKKTTKGLPPSGLWSEEFLGKFEVGGSRDWV
jgi:hypothetical protein